MIRRSISLLVFATGMFFTVQANAQSSEGEMISRLKGKWRAGSVSTVQYRNSYTGAYAPTSGSTFFYEFFPDGTYRNNGLLQMTTYGCTSSVWRENSGRYRVEGDRIYIEPAKGIVKSQVCGGQPSEKQDKLDTEVHVFRFEQNGQGEVLVMNGLDSKSRPDYFRREKGSTLE